MNSDSKKNELHKTVSLHERTALKLFPIVEEVLKTIVQETTPFEYLKIGERHGEADMRSILGFLN